MSAAVRLNRTEFGSIFSPIMPLKDDIRPSWDQLQESIAMLRLVAHAEADFEAGREFSTEEVFSRARKAKAPKRPTSKTS